MKATILDTKTGLIGEQRCTYAWQYYENNYSCDCNRNLWENYEDREEPRSSLTRDCTHNRFLVIDAEYEEADKEVGWPEAGEGPGEAITGGWTLEELNQEYPPELLAQYLHKTPLGPISVSHCYDWHDELNRAWSTMEFEETH